MRSNWEIMDNGMDSFWKIPISMILDPSGSSLDHRCHRFSEPSTGPSSSAIDELPGQGDSHSSKIRGEDREI